MSVRGWALLLLLVAGCTSAPTAPQPARTSPTAAQAASPAPTVTPQYERPVVTLNFSCTLPVYAPDGVYESFVKFPGRAVTPAGRSQTNHGGIYFDEAVRRWLPVPRAAVSPDGLRYAYTEGWNLRPPTAPRVHIVNAATDADIRVVTMPDAQPYRVADLTAGGVFVVISYGATAPGVWRVDPATGSVTKASDGYYVPAGPGWMTVLDPGDSKPFVSAASGLTYPDRIDRRDAAGTITTWFYKPGAAVFVAGYAGRAEAFVTSVDNELGVQLTKYWLLTAPGQARELTYLTTDAVYADFDFLGARSDVHGIWFGGGAIYLATPEGLVDRVYVPQPVDRIFPANGCY